MSPSFTFTFGTGDEAVLNYRELPRRAIRKVQHWRECRTVAEQLDAVRALFEAVLHGDTVDGEPLYDCSKLGGTGYLDDDHPRAQDGVEQKPLPHRGPPR